MNRNAVEIVSGAQLYRMETTPVGRSLYTYFAAVLIVTEMNRGSVYPLNKFFKNFSGHVRAGRIEKVAGGYRLTRSGIAYFEDRFNPSNPQHVDDVQVRAMVQHIKKGRVAGWVPVE